MLLRSSLLDNAFDRESAPLQNFAQRFYYTACLVKPDIERPWGGAGAYDEYKAIKKLGPFENLLLVTGENPAKAGVPYLAKALDIAKKYFSNLKIEVMPLKAEEYAELKEHGLNGVICFQETYNKARYNIYHPRGMKSKFEWRVKSIVLA